MANLAFYTTPSIEINETKIFGTTDTAAHFAKVFGDNASLQRSLSALQRGPVRFYRDNVIAFDDDVADYLLFVVAGVVRSCRFAKAARAASFPFTCRVSF